MAENSKIEWTDHTFNPWIGCTKVGPGCDNCYAETLMDTRLGRAHWGAGQPRVRTSAANWRKPLAWNKAAAESGRRMRVFCASLADVFDNEVPTEWRCDLFRLIHDTPHLDWLLLTKRIGNARTMIADALCYVNVHQRGADLFEWLADWKYGVAPKNVWLGATVVTQQEADRDIPKLLETSAFVRFLSCEPLLGPVDRTRGSADFTARCRRALIRGEPRPPSLDWIIVGGESGRGARPMEVAWAQHIRNQCLDHGVAFFMKQGSAANWPLYKDFAQFPRSLQVREFPEVA